jgi:hypothetical protein
MERTSRSIVRLATIAVGALIAFSAVRSDDLVTEIVGAVLLVLLIGVDHRRSVQRTEQTSQINGLSRALQPPRSCVPRRTHRSLKPAVKVAA